METRLLVAYLLIGLLVAAAVFLLRRAMVRSRKHRRLMRGRGSHKHAMRH